MFNIFFQAVQNEPESTAIILSNKEKLTYKETNELVTLWARYFITMGVHQGDKVAVLINNEDLYPFLHLALDKINATIIPLDMESPIAQLETDIKKLNPKKILLDEKLSTHDVIPESIKLYFNNANLLPVDDESSLKCLPLIERDPDIPNYIVASSGVSADKKWIPINSQGLIYWAKVEISLLQLSKKDKILCTRSPAYDARISEYVRAFSGHGTLVLMSQADRRDLNAILKQCEQEKITGLILIASQLAMSNQEEIIQRLAKAGLTHLLVTGDACSLSLKHLCEQYKINLWNCYGPTEATFGMSIVRVNQKHIYDENQQPAVPIGFPEGEEVRFHIIDECLYIESPFLSPGYIDNPELTQKNFPTLFLNGRWVRVFNTENKFAVKDDSLIFKGRIDNDAHIKVSGVKVEPFAIQQCIEQYNEEIGQKVLDVYIVVKPWLQNNKPFAYLLIHRDFSKDHFMSYLKKWLRKEELPIIVVLPEFPRLVPSEKIDRRALIARSDHPDEFFFNEGKQNKEKFSASGLGLKPSAIIEINNLVSSIKSNQFDFKNSVHFFKQVDKIVLAANHLDQNLNLNESNKEKVLEWLDVAYRLVIKFAPQYHCLVENNLDEAFLVKSPVSHLASIAQLFFYYGKALRYNETASENRIKFLKSAVNIASFLEEKSSSEDLHAFRGRLLTYNLAVMLCLKDLGDLNAALTLAKQQSHCAYEKQEVFHIVQYKSYISGLLLSLNQPEEALQYAKESLDLARQFYQYQVIFCNAAIAYIKCCIQNNDKNEACDLAREIIAAHKKNPLCGVKLHHLQEARNILKSHDELAKIWCNVLQLNSSDEEQEFMVLGGDSFLLSQLVVLIQQKLDPGYSYQKLLNLPALTLGQIRTSLQNNLANEQSSAIIRPLITLDKEKPNYFFLPTLLGEGYFTYKELAQIFSSHYQFNVYGLSDPSIYDPSLLPKTLDEAAIRYVQTIKKTQPKGPYNLLGFSYGATLAYYVAKLLLAQGEKIEALHLVDSFPPEMYQNLSAKSHAQLLEELINFVIKTLNNRFYDEKLKLIKLTNFDKLLPAVQINKSFDALILKVKKTESKALLMLARQHLLLMLESKEVKKIPVWANLYLSTPNQTYLNVIHHIHKIVKKSSHCQSYFWNHYFEEVNLAGKRTSSNHLQLLQSKRANWGESAHLFWERAHDPLYNLAYDYFGPTPYYYLEQKDETNDTCHLYSLDWRYLAFFKKEFSQHPEITDIRTYHLYDRIAEKYERRDRIYAAKYSISFTISRSKLPLIHDLLGSKKIEQAHSL